MSLFQVETVPLHAMVSYPSWDYKETKWRDEDHKAYFLVHCIKKNAAKVKDKVYIFNLSSGAVNVGRSNMHVGQQFFAKWAAQVLKRSGLQQVCLVPVPNRGAIASAVSFNTSDIARLVQQEIGATATVFDGVRFIKALPKTDGAPKPSYSELVANMQLVGTPGDGPIVVIDDVYSRGVSVRATTHTLGRKPEMVIVCGRTENVPIDGMCTPRALEHELW